MNSKIILVILLVFCLSAIMFAFFYPIHFRLYQQTFSNTVLGPFLLGNQAGEHVFFPLPNISRVDVRVATYNRVNNSILTCHIEQAESILSTRNIDARHCRDNEIFSIYFHPQVELDPEKGFSVLFQSNADLEKKNYISLYLSSQNKSGYSQFFLNHEEYPGQNLWIRIYSRLTIVQVLQYMVVNLTHPLRKVVPAIILIVLAFILLKIACTCFHDVKN